MGRANLACMLTSIALAASMAQELPLPPSVSLSVSELWAEPASAPALVYLVDAGELPAPSMPPSPARLPDPSAPEPLPAAMPAASSPGALQAELPAFPMALAGRKMLQAFAAVAPSPIANWMPPTPAPAPLLAPLPGVDFTRTVLGLPPDMGYVKWPWSELGPVPAGFDPPAIPNITFYGLAEGTPLPPLLSGNSYVQLAPGVIAVIPSGDEAYIQGQAQPAAAPAAGPGPDREELQAALAAAKGFAVPQGFQVFVLPANASIPDLSGSLPIPASFNLPAALQSYNYLLKPAASNVDIPPTYTHFLPEPGVTIIYSAPAVLASAPVPQGPTSTVILASDLSFAAAASLANAPFSMALSGPMPAGYLPPPGLKGYDFTAVMAGTVLPTILNGFVIIPINNMLTAIASTGSPLYGAATAALQASVGPAPLPMLSPAAAPVPAPSLPAAPGSPGPYCPTGDC